MSEKRDKKDPAHLDPREFELPDTIYSRNIENKVFQGIIVKTLSLIPGISLIEGTFLDNLIGRVDKIQGIEITQDPKTQSVKLTIHVRVQYGVSIPQIAETIQTTVAEEVTKITGVRVSEVHVIFKELISNTAEAKQESISDLPKKLALGQTPFEDEF